MSAAQTVLDAQAEALLQRLARENESRCRRALDDAREQAQSIVARAYQDARARLRQAVAEERKGLREAVAARRAEIETKALKRRQAVMSVALDRAWSQFEQALWARWQDASARMQWVDAAAGIARATLLELDELTIELDESLDDHAAAQITDRLVAQGLPQPVVRRAAGLGPGLRMLAGPVRIDASLAGLLRSRGRIEAELLAELERQRSAGEPDRK
jgi:vacuolar-type H+-ATPase subunit H